MVWIGCNEKKPEEQAHWVYHTLCDIYLQGFDRSVLWAMAHSLPKIRTPKHIFSQSRGYCVYYLSAASHLQHGDLGGHSPMLPPRSRALAPWLYCSRNLQRANIHAGAQLSVRAARACSRALGDGCRAKRIRHVLEGCGWRWKS